MSRRMQGAAIAAVLALQPLAGQAADLALVLSIQTNMDISARNSGAAAEGLAEDLRVRGWTVFQATDASGVTMRSQARKLQAALAQSSGPDRILIVISGLVAQTDRDAWLIEPGITELDTWNLGTHGLSLGALAELAGEAPGKAVLIIAASEQVPEGSGGARVFSGTLALPQGVTMISGPMGGLRRWARDVLLAPGTSFFRAIESLPGEATASGFVSDSTGFADPDGDGGGASPMGEMAYWNAVSDIGTEAGFRAYLERFPQGIFAAEARAELRLQTLSPGERAEQDEAALRLTRDARRRIQRNLALLGFDPRGIDGVFGRGSRAAIAAWQRSAGQPDHGYLTGPQLETLQGQADVRAAELEREARLRREAEEQADRRYWRQLGRDEASLRAYLKRYPDGLFAGEARAELDLILEDRRRAVEARQRVAWDAAREADTIAAYDRFLSEFPEGGFAGEARERRAELVEDARTAGQTAAAQRAEAEVLPNRGARVLVEQVLQLRGLKPGPVDGEFTRDTRRAIRRFQKAQGLPVTGFVSQQTMVVLMLSNR